MFVSTFVGAQDRFFEDADRFFKTYVDDQGRVDYEAIKGGPAQLDALVEKIAEAQCESMSPEAHKAFLINAYNILVIKQVIDLYPIKSPLDEPSFFNGIRHNVGGQMLTLDQIEKGRLMMSFHDERTHFVLVCAAVSCPPLANFGFFPDGLEEQLQERTAFVLNLDWFVVVDKKTELSQIFNWYRADFEMTGKSLVGYINDYRKEKITNTKQPKFYEYDWSLNGKK